MTDSMQQFFAARPQSVSQARQFADRALKGWGRTGRAEDVRLCVSELTTNAVVHGTTRGHGFLLRIDFDDEVVGVEVHDSRRQQPQVRDALATDLAGRGLVLVAALADEWGIEDRRPIGKIVWSCFKAGSA
ncbi:ATP-binding protein [Streptomyces boluensis]|uniref:ATP-binding protein n=1 Tax=Streptomyces boluensis TaxID=1775135 RepID=A0A964UL28_9ACTN|nr:ATP-binding protein [Streptomyces boluensis]NBE50607.1 ATP-binding protein [Streptomyces boluensis]